MHPVTLLRLFVNPAQGWQDLLDSRPSIHRLYLLHVVPFALIPPIMIYLSSQRHGDALFDLVRLIPSNKLFLVSLAFFIVQLIVVPGMAAIIRQLSEVAEVYPNFRQAFILASVAPTPLWMAPVFLVVPDILVNIAVTSLAMMASAGFIHFGIPAVFEVKEKGHALLLFGAILMAGIITWGFLMVCTLMLWGSMQNLQFASG